MEGFTRTEGQHCVILCMLCVCVCVLDRKHLCASVSAICLPFLFLSLARLLFLGLSAALPLISTRCSSGLEASPGLFFFILPVLQKREKGTSVVPLEPLVFQRGSINLSPCKQRKPQATNDLLVYLFQYFRWLV